MIYYKTKEGAEIAQSKMNAKIDVFCPLIVGSCHNKCVCFSCGSVRLLENGEFKGKYKMTAGYCNNMMFFRE